MAAACELPLVKACEIAATYEVDEGGGGGEELVEVALALAAALLCADTLLVNRKRQAKPAAAMA